MNQVIVAVQACQGIAEGSTMEVHHFRNEGKCREISGGKLLEALFSGRAPSHSHEPAQKGGMTMVVSTDYKGQTINVGYAVCVETDNFDRKDGRKRATTRLEEKDEAYSFSITIPTLMEMAKAEMSGQGLFDYLSKPAIDKLEYQDIAREAVKSILNNMVKIHHQRFHFGPNSLKNRARQAEKAAAKVAKELAKKESGSPDSGSSNNS